MLSFFSLSEDYIVHYSFYFSGDPMGSKNFLVSHYPKAHDDSNLSELVIE